MDEDRLKGIGKQVAGSIKEAVGKVIDDTKVQAKGTAEKTVKSLPRATPSVMVGDH